MPVYLPYPVFRTSRPRTALGYALESPEQPEPEDDPAPTSGLLLQGAGWAWTPPSAAFDVADLDVELWASTYDGAMANVMTLVDRWEGSDSNASWTIRTVGSSSPDKLRMYTQPPGTAANSPSMFPAPVSSITTRVTRAAATGLTTWYTWDVDTEEWVSKGTSIVNLGAVPNTGGTANLTIGAHNATVAPAQIPLDSVVFKMVLRDGIDGTVVADPDFTDTSQGWRIGDLAGATGIDSLGNVWTLAGDASVF